MRYSSTDSQNLIQIMRSNVASANQMIDRLSEGCNHLTLALESGELAGAAYTAGKELFAEVIIPCVYKLQLAVEDISSELRSYEYADSIVAEYGILDKTVLEQRLQLKYNQLSEVEEQLEVNQRFMYQVQALFSGQLDTLWNQTQSLEDLKWQLEKGIQETQTQLDKLQWFHDDVSRYFTDSLEVLQLAVQAAIALQSITLGEDGCYYANGVDLSVFSRLSDKSLRTFDRGTDPKLSLIQDNVLDLMLSEEAASYYREQLLQLLKGKPSNEWPFLIASYNQLLWFDDEGNIIDVIPFSGGPGAGLLVLKNGKYDLAYTKEANQEYNSEQWDNIKDYAGQLALGLLELLGGMGAGAAGTAFAAGGFVLALPSGGTITVPAVAASGTSFALSGTLVAAGTAHVNDAIIQITAAQAQFQVSFAQNHDDWKVNKPASRSFGKKVSGRINGKKVDNIRVDAEPHSGKIQIQSGSGKSGYDLNIDIKLSEIPNEDKIIQWVQSHKKLRGLSSSEKQQIIQNMLKAYRWLKGIE